MVTIIYHRVLIKGNHQADSEESGRNALNELMKVVVCSPSSYKGILLGCESQSTVRRLVFVVDLEVLSNLGGSQAYTVPYSTTKSVQNSSRRRHG